MTEGISSYEQGQKAFKQISIGDQLTLLWVIYTKLGKSITPAAPGAAGTAIAESLCNQLKALSHPEQIQAQQDIASGADTLYGREYGSLSDDTKLAFWYYLGVGMEDGSIAPLPIGAELSEPAKQLLTELEAMDYGKQISFLRGSVLLMGAEPALGAEI
jgi:Orange carotenoid protein, N-terminal